MADNETIDQKRRKIELAQAKLRVNDLTLQGVKPDSDAHKQQIETLKKEAAQLKADIRKLELEISAKLESALTDKGVYVQALLIQRLGVFEDASGKCKAMVAAQ